MNLSNFTQEELEKLFFLRASEWSDWPCYLIMGFGQLFLLHFPFYKLLFAFIIIEIIWFLIAEKIVSFKLAYNFYWIHGLMYLTSPIVAIILYTKGHILMSVIALLWFFALALISFILHSVLVNILRPFKIFPPMIGIINLKMQSQVFDIDKNTFKQKIQEAENLRQNFL